MYCLCVILLLYCLYLFVCLGFVCFEVLFSISVAMAIVIIAMRINGAERKGNVAMALSSFIGYCRTVFVLFLLEVPLLLLSLVHLRLLRLMER